MATDGQGQGHWRPEARTWGPWPGGLCPVPRDQPYLGESSLWFLLFLSWLFEHFLLRLTFE